jgi:hypothetical protein
MGNADLFGSNFCRYVFVDDQAEAKATKTTRGNDEGTETGG